MNSDPLFFKYHIIAEYVGNGDSIFKGGDQAEGVLAFNFDTGVVKLSISLSENPFEFFYPTWNSFELEWKVIDRS